MIAPTITYLTDIYFGAGAARSLGEIAGKYGLRRPLLVTDKGIASTDLLGQINLPPHVRFDAVESNPDESAVRAGLQAYRDDDCHGVLAIGGGSPIDCAKAIALLVTHPEPLRQYAMIEGGVPRITANKPPLIAVPTTAGTGSEVGRGALVTFADGAKLAMISPHLIPQAAVCDPQLTLGLPPTLTAATGMDAISHCVETYCSPRYNPVADAIALDGLARACRNLRRTVDTPTDITARSEMLMAATMGGLTFQKGLGAIHALSHPLGGLREPRLHHGMLNAVLLPHVLRFNAASCADKIDAMARLLGTSDLSSYFEQLTTDIALPRRLRDMGATLEQCLSTVDGALRDHSNASNPRKMERADAEALLHAAW